MTAGGAVLATAEGAGTLSTPEGVLVGSCRAGGSEHDAEPSPKTASRRVIRRVTTTPMLPQRGELKQPDTI